MSTPISTSTSITVPAGTTLKTTGSGVAVLGPGDRANQQIVLQGSNQIGPFSADKVVYITPSGSLSYDMNQLDVPTLLPAQPDLATLNAAYPAASNAGKEVMVGKVRYKSDGSTWYKADDASGLVGSKIVTLALAGDSFATNQNRNFQPSAAVASGGVVTVTQTAHAVPPGGLISTTGFNQSAANVHKVAITVVDANTFTYPAPGAADGNLMSSLVMPCRIIDYKYQQDCGAAVHLVRASGGGVTVVSNAGASGNTMRYCLNYWDARVSAYSPKATIWWAGYNDLYQIALGTAGYSATSMLADLAAVIAKAQACGTFLIVPSLCAIASGVGADVAVAHQALLTYNAQGRVLVEAAGYQWIDIYQDTVGSDGKARSGVYQADNIHPGWDLCRRLAARIMAAQKASNSFAPRTMCTSAYDNVGSAGTTSTNVIRALPISGNTAGSIAGNTTSALPSGETGTAGVSSGYTCASTATSGNAWTNSAANGAGVQWQRVTSAASGNNMRTSYSVTASDVLPGDTVYAACMASLTTAHAGSNQTPAGQNVQTFQLRLIATVDSVAYNLYESSPTLTPSQADLNSICLAIDGVKIPTGTTLNSLRFDLLTEFSGAGTAQQALWSPSLRKSLTL